MHDEGLAHLDTMGIVAHSTIPSDARRRCRSYHDGVWVLVWTGSQTLHLLAFRKQIKPTVPTWEYGKTAFSGSVSLHRYSTYRLIINFNLDDPLPRPYNFLCILVTLDPLWQCLCSKYGNCCGSAQCFFSGGNSLEAILTVVGRLEAMETCVCATSTPSRGR